MRPSLDRIDPEQGYVFGNLVWSTNFANRARGDMPVREFAELLRTLGLQNRYHEKMATNFAAFGGK